MIESLILSEQPFLSPFLKESGVTLDNEDGIFTITVPKNGKIKLKIVFARDKTHCRIIAQEKSTLDMLNDFKLNVHESTIELIGKEGATINLTNLFLRQNKRIMLDEKIILAKGAKAYRNSAYLFGNNITDNCLVSLEGEGAEIEDKGVLFGTKAQHIKTNIIIVHVADNTISRSTVKGIANDNASCEAKGTVRVLPHVKKTVSRLAEHILLLNQGAEASAQPSMEIEALDVQASHSASVTKIDENHIFYAMARGMEYDNARKLIAEGFLAQITETLPEEVESGILQKWGK